MGTSSNTRACFADDNNGINHAPCSPCLPAAATAWWRACQLPVATQVTELPLRMQSTVRREYTYSTCVTSNIVNIPDMQSTAGWPICQPNVVVHERRTQMVEVETPTFSRILCPPQTLPPPSSNCVLWLCPGAPRLLTDCSVDDLPPPQSSASCTRTCAGLGGVDTHGHKVCSVA